jgi:hypothetical protein
MVPTMGTSTPAEDMPALYRAILDRVAALEAAGKRSEAARVRREATAAYSRAWDDRTRRRLTHLLRAAGQPNLIERRLARVRRPATAAGTRTARPAVFPER